MIVRDNPYAALFDSYRDQLKNDPSVELNMYIHKADNSKPTRSKTEAKRYNSNPAAGQIAAVFSPDDEGFPPELYVNFNN